MVRDTLLTARRSMTTLLLGTALLLGGVTAWAGEMLVSRVTWTDPGGGLHEGVFQGWAKGRTLTGHVFEGRARLAVDGTLDDDGGISGRLVTSDGTTVGYFAAAFDGGTLRGGFANEAGGEGALSAPATCLAVEAARRRGEREPVPDGCSGRKEGFR